VVAGRISQADFVQPLEKGRLCFEKVQARVAKRIVGVENQIPTAAARLGSRRVKVMPQRR
jgi:hypothetical protein